MNDTSVISRMNPEIKELWVAELENDIRVQGEGRLHRVSPEGVHKFCCLGVLCDLAFQAGVVERVLKVSSFDGIARYAYGTATENTLTLPSEVMMWAGLENHDPRVNTGGTLDFALSGLNDSGRSFREIAGFIRESL